MGSYLRSVNARMGTVLREVLRAEALVLPFSCDRHHLDSTSRLCKAQTRVVPELGLQPAIILDTKADCRDNAARTTHQLETSAV
jgi:hypothetical protein